jgi:uncharacterized membrane protein
MWGPGAWAGPMWGFWWIFPLMGFVMCLIFVVGMIRMMAGGRGFACMGGHQAADSDETARLRREIDDLRQEVRTLRQPAP